MTTPNAPKDRDSTSPNPRQRCPRILLEYAYYSDALAKRGARHIVSFVGDFIPL